MDSNLSSKDRNSLLLYGTGNKPSSSSEGLPSGGRITQALSGALSFDRDSSLLDSLTEKNRNALIKSDEEYSIQRSKPVELTPEEFSTTLALSFGISQEVGRKELSEAITRIKEKTGGANVFRYVDISNMAKFLYGRADSTQKAQVIRDLFALSKKYQILMLGENKKKLRPVTSPLIKIDPEGIVFKEVDGTKVSVPDFANFLKTASPEQIADSVEGFNVGFGVAFLYNLDNEWSYIPKRIFPILRKNKLELFRTLLSSMLNVYIDHRNRANKAEEDKRREIGRTKRLSREQYFDLIKEARQEKMIFERNIDTIKNKLKRDYLSTKQYRAAFIKDLKKAAQSLMEIGLIESYEIVKGSKGQDKLVFVLSETYNYTISEEESNPTKFLKEKKQEEGEIEPF